MTADYKGDVAPCTDETLRRWLDEHGRDGAPSAPGWHVVEIIRNLARDPGGEVSVVVASDTLTVFVVAGYRLREEVDGYDIARHAPLPDFVDLAQQAEESRRAVAALAAALLEDAGINPAAVLEQAGLKAAAAASPLVLRGQVGQ